MRHVGTKLLIGGIAAAATLAAVVYLPPIMMTLFKTSLSRMGVLEAVVAIVTLGTGMALYVVRERHRHLYGVAELSFGVTVAAYTASKFRAELLDADLDNIGAWSGSAALLPWLTIVACIYVVVRGVENAVKGDVELRAKEENVVNSQHDI